MTEKNKKDEEEENEEKEKSKKEKAEETEKTQAEEIDELLAARAKNKSKDNAGESADGDEPDESEENQNLDEGDAKEAESKEKKLKKERIGILHIRTTKNNTILLLTDMTGNTIAKSSGGQSTKQSRLKSSPTVAMFAAKKIGEEARDAGVTSLYVRIKRKTGAISAGSASHAVIKSLSRDGFKILNITDITKQPRGGPKASGGRRGRRV